MTKKSRRAPVLEPAGRARPGNIGRIAILDVRPQAEGGLYPAKAGVGEIFPIQATVFREGHDVVGATVVLRDLQRQSRVHARMPSINPGIDLFEARISLPAPGPWSFHVEGWFDPYGAWVREARAKLPANVDVALVLEEGCQVLSAWTQEAHLGARDRGILQEAIDTLRDETLEPAQRLAAATSDDIALLADKRPLRRQVTRSVDLPLIVDRSLSLFNAWYQIFPRSEGATRDEDGHWHSGTFATAARRLPAIRDMGFDVVYLPPIHPIGHAFRKGPDNAPVAGPDDPGSPWAIGSELGGHDAIDPALGTLADFRAFIREARSLGLEVALDLALQCSPDHPWVHEHPEWFAQRPDGSIAYAENPPKKYQDIYPLNFDNDPSGLVAEILRIMRHWIRAGVTIFRVDNPHTKPVWVWQHIFADIRRTNPEVLFLAEAFTRPPIVRALGYAGFHTSHSYFPWRNEKEELAEYLEEISGDAGFFVRSTFWPTTPDILTDYLVEGGVAGHAVRAVLAALGSPSWGIYGGYELMQDVVQRPGAEEPAHNEKYEYRPRDWSKAREIGLSTLLTSLNRIRRAHPALQSLHDLTIHETTNDHLLAFSRHVAAADSTAGRDDTLIVVVNLDPRHAQQGRVLLDQAAPGTAGRLHLRDELSGQTFEWGPEAYVSLAPWADVAHVAAVVSRR